MNSFISFIVPLISGIISALLLFDRSRAKKRHNIEVKVLNDVIRDKTETIEIIAEAERNRKRYDETYNGSDLPNVVTRLRKFAKDRNTE